MMEESVLREERSDSVTYLQTVPRVDESRAFFKIKRLFDLIASFCGLCILSPLFLVICIAIKINSKGPVIYSQRRVGRRGKIFTMYKFRSMCEEADVLLDRIRYLDETDGPVFKIRNDPRVTGVGQFLRKTSLDELPQLLNVLKGDMSIVGPRPPLQNEVELYTPYEKQRLCVKPGLTCYWQISGRSDVSFDEWVAMDLKYITGCSIPTDLKIILKTVPAVVSGKGAY